MSSASDEFDQNSTDINQYLSKDLIGVIQRITCVNPRSREYRKGPRYRFYVYPDAIVTRKGSKKELYEKRSTQFSAKDSTVREVIKATEKYFMDKCVLIKKSESVSGTTSTLTSSSSTNTPVLSNDFLNMQRLKHELKELRKEKEKIEKQLKNKNEEIRKLKISKSRKKRKKEDLNKASTQKGGTEKSDRMKRYDTVKVLDAIESISNRNADYARALVERVSSKMIESNESSETKHIQEKAMVMDRIVKTFSTLKVQKQRYNALRAMQTIITAAAPATTLFGQVRILERVFQLSNGSTLVRNGIRRKQEYERALKRVGPFKTGDVVECSSGQGKISAITQTSITIELDFGVDGIHSVTFPKYQGSSEKEKRSRKYGRIVHYIPPLYNQNLRKARNDRTSNNVRKDVQEFIKKFCTESSCRRDVKHRVLATKVVVSAPGLLLNESLEKIYEKFLQTVNYKISWTTFLKSRQWNLRKAYRETCLCSRCLKFSGLSECFYNEARFVLEEIKSVFDEQKAKKTFDTRNNELYGDVVKMIEFAYIAKRSRKALCSADCCESMFNSMVMNDCVEGECGKCSHIKKVVSRIVSNVKRNETDDDSDGEQTKVDDEGSARVTSTFNRRGGRQRRFDRKAVRLVGGNDVRIL